jgi:hypothetical protein
LNFIEERGTEVVIAKSYSYE